VDGSKVCIAAVHKSKISVTPYMLESWSRQAPTKTIGIVKAT